MNKLKHTIPPLNPSPNLPTLPTSHSSPLLTEDILTSHRSKIFKLKQTQQISNSKRKISENDLYANHEKHISFITPSSEMPSQWEYSSFSTHHISTQEIPSIQSIIQWNQCEPLYSPTNIRNLIFKSKDEIDYGLANVEINMKILLQNESTFWLFLHGDEEAFGCNGDDRMGMVAVVQVSKVESSQNVFLSMGVFLENGEYKVFSRQQLVNVRKDKGKDWFREEDKCLVRMNVQDTGDDNMQVKVRVNNSVFENVIDADFFEPVNTKKMFVIAGSGELCEVQEFDVVSYVKPKYVKEFNILSHKNPYHSNNKNCDCCNII